MYSCTYYTVLYAMEHWIKSLAALDDGNDVDIVHLDFCKAFDCAPHQHILSTYAS